MNLRIEQSDREYNILKKQRKISLLQLKVLEDEYEMLKKQEKKRFLKFLSLLLLSLYLF